MRTRRDLLAQAAAAAAAPLLAKVRPEPAGRRVLLVDIDDIGHGLLEEAMSIAGAPNLRHAIAMGRSYENFWAAPFCSPFRARVLTGLDAYRVGNLVGTFIPNGAACPAPTGQPWLPAGLPGDSVKVGKWHISDASNFPGVVVAGGYGRLRGGILGNIGNDGGTYDSWTEWFSGPSGSGSQTVTIHNTTYTAQLVLDEIALGTELIHASFQAVHAPLHSPPDNEPAGKIYSGQTDNQKRLDMLYHLDHWLGVVIQSAVSMGYVVLIASDNGTSGEGKGTHSEDGNNTPLIVCGQGVLPGVSPRLVQSTDLWATVRRLRGVTTSSTPDSHDFADDFLAVLPGAPPRAFMTIDWFPVLGVPPPASQWSRMIRNERWKYLDRKTSPASTFPVPFQALWDLESDPDEQVNLLDQPLSAEAQAAHALLLANLQ